MIAFTLSTFEWQNSIDEDIVHTYMSAGPLVFLYPLRFVRLHMSVGHCLLPVKHAVIHISIIARKALQIGKKWVKKILATSGIDSNMHLTFQEPLYCSQFLLSQHSYMSLHLSNMCKIQNSRV